MGKLQIFDILLDQNPAVYYPGNVVSGHVVVELSDVMKMRGIRLKFSGNARVHWSERHSTGSGKNRRTVTRHYHNQQAYFNMTVTLYGKAEGQSGSDPEHPTGRHVYPFQFTLPQHLPSSFEGQSGQVRFFLQGVIDKPWKFNHHCKRPFTVISVLDLNFQDNARLAQNGQSQKTLCCLCCASGPITAKFSLDRRGYVSGEFIIISGEATNMSNRKMCSSSVELRMVTSFHATTKTRTLTKIVSKIKKGEIAPGDSEVWSGERLYIPPLPPSLLPYCDIIHIFYRVVMVVDPSGPAFDLEVPLEIIIGTIPLQNVQYVFATSQCPYSLPPTYDDATPPATEHTLAPSASETQPSAPPPSYAECVTGKVNMRDDDDNEYTRGELDWAPVYPYYALDGPARV